MSNSTRAPQRDWLIDVLRVLSVVVVVLMHWTWMRVTYVDHRLELHDSLNGGVMRALTWVLMIMPLFFLAGGFANALIVDRCRARGDGFGAFLGLRARRLLTPALPLLALFTLLGLVTPRLGTGVARTAANQPANVLWFLAVYLICTALAPLQVWTHDRLGWWVGPAAWLAGAAAIDALHLHGLLDGTCNMLFVWPACHAFGVLYQRGTLRRAPTWALLSFAALVAAGIWATVRLGWFAPQNIGLAGESEQNLMPPTSVLAWLGVIQFCLLVPLARRLSDWTPGRPLQKAILTLNALLIHTYLWHVPVLVALTGVGMAAPNLLLPTDPGRWWATRLLWLPIAAVLLAGIVMLATRWDVFVARYGARRDPVVVLLACLLGVVGLDFLWLRGISANPVCVGATAAVALAAALLTTREARPHRRERAQLASSGMTAGSIATGGAAAETGMATMAIQVSTGA